MSTYSYSVTSVSSLRVPGIMFTCNKTGYPLYTSTDIMITSGALGAGSRLGSSELWSIAGPEILKQIVK